MLILHEGRPYQTRSGHPDSHAKYSSAVPFPSANTFVGYSQKLLMAPQNGVKGLEP